jgi:NADPH:quinone reductase-like Zn-dependent oxidoreductase
MHALRFHRHGQPHEALAFEEVPTPAPGPGEALIELDAAGINPSDVKNVGGAFPQTTLPRVPGRDFAGRVVYGSTQWQGKDVFGTGAGLGYVRDGTHAEYVIVPEEGLALRPASLPPALAAQVGVPYVTAAEGLARAKVVAGDHVLVIGATGAVGRAVAQIAKWAGAHVIGTTLKESDVDEAARRHVDAWVDLSREELAPAARAATGGAGADIAFNVVGGATFAPTLEALAIGGRMVCIAATKDPVPLDVKHLYRHDQAILGIDSLKLGPRDIAVILQRLARGFDTGALLVAPGLETPLNEGVAAYTALNEGRGGKRVLVMKA